MRIVSATAMAGIPEPDRVSLVNLSRQKPPTPFTPRALSGVFERSLLKEWKILNHGRHRLHGKNAKTENENRKSKNVQCIRVIEPDCVFRDSLSVCSVPSVVKGIFEWLLLNQSTI